MATGHHGKGHVFIVLLRAPRRRKRAEGPGPGSEPPSTGATSGRPYLHVVRGVSLACGRTHKYHQGLMNQVCLNKKNTGVRAQAAGTRHPSRSRAPLLRSGCRAKGLRGTAGPGPPPSPPPDDAQVSRCFQAFPSPPSSETDGFTLRQNAAPCGRSGGRRPRHAQPPSPGPGRPHHWVGVQRLHPALQMPAPGFAAQPLRHILGRARLAAEEDQQPWARHRGVSGPRSPLHPGTGAGSRGRL